MKIKILGSGTIISGKKRNPAGYLLEYKSSFALIDMGPGTIRQLITLEIDMLKINAVFISHFHFDHCSDLLPFLLRRYLLKKRFNEDFRVFGPVGLKEWFSGQSALQGSWLTEHLIELIEFREREILWKNLKIRAILNGHTENSLSYRFEGDKSLFYSADTGFNQDLIPFAKDADHAIMECSVPDGQEADGHLTPSTVGFIAEKANIKKLIISHIYPKNDTDDLKDRIGKYFSGEIIIASDYLEINI